MLNLGGSQSGLLGSRRAQLGKPMGLAPLPCKSQLHLQQGLAGAGRRRSGVLLREALSTDTQETQKKQQGTPELNGHHSAGMNGNGRPAPAVMPSKPVQDALASTSNGTSSSNNGSASPSSNGVTPSSMSSNSSNNGAPKTAASVVIEASASPVTSSTSTPSLNGASTAKSSTHASLNGAGNASQNGTGSSATKVSPPASNTTTTTTTINATKAPSSSTPSSSPRTPASSSPSSETAQPVVLEQDGHIELEAVTAQPNQRRLNKSAEGTPYNAPGGRWSSFKEYSVLRRTLEIWTFAVQFAWRYILINKKWTYKNPGGMTPEAVSARKKEVAVWLREGLVRLGPTFIKIGQQFSTRVDVLSQEFVKELEMLQDNVPAFDSKTAREIVQYHLGRPIEEVFTKFDEQPIAAASLGQVHLASIGDQQVVVKVQRPGLKELFDIDLKNIRQLAVWLQKLDPKTDGAARDWVAIYDECSRILYQEIDYTLEGKNADKFRENFKNTDWVKVPRVFWEYSSSEVLVLEYMPGVKVNNAEALDSMGLDRSRLARLSVESYLQQILRYGFFHADPHPGNVAVDKDGKLIYYDFGMMGTLQPTVREGLLDLFYGVFNRDSDKCIQALTTMGVYVPTGDKTAVRRTADYFLSSFQERLEQQKAERNAKGAKYNENFKPQRTKDEQKAKRKEIFTSVGEDLLLAANDQPFRFPATFTFVVRSFTVLDGIGKSLDARFDISEIAAPYARELLLEGAPQVSRLQKALGKGLQNQNRAVANLFKNPNKIEEVASTLQKLERGDLKLRVRALETERALTRVQVSFGADAEGGHC